METERKPDNWITVTNIQNDKTTILNSLVSKKTLKQNPKVLHTMEKRQLEKNKPYPLGRHNELRHSQQPIIGRIL